LSKPTKKLGVKASDYHPVSDYPPGNLKPVSGYLPAVRITSDSI